MYLNGEYLKQYDQCEAGLDYIPLNISGLLQKTNYLVQIKSVDSKGSTSDLSMPHFFKTKDCTSPSNIKVGVFLLHFSDFKNIVLWSADSFEKNYFNQMNYLNEPLDIENWFSRVSAGKVNLSHEIFGPWSLELPSRSYRTDKVSSLATNCDSRHILEDFKKLAKEYGINVDREFDRYVFVLTGVRTNSWTWGKNIFLSGHGAYYDAFRAPTLSYLSLAHELGHALGLPHNSIFADSCSYPKNLNDLSDCHTKWMAGSSIMGKSGRGLNSEERRLLGALSNSQILNLPNYTGTHIVKIDNLNSINQRGVKQVKIRRNLPGFYYDTFFFLDYRFNDGVYATLDVNGKKMTPGVYISLRRSSLNELSGDDGQIIEFNRPLTLDNPELYMPEHKIYLKLLEVTPEFAKIQVSPAPE